MFTSPTTAIFPVAGRGTRMLPATRAVPKELLPILDRPVLDFAVDEALAAGMRRLVFVTHPTKPAIRAHLEARDDLPGDTELHFVNQTDALGLGHAVLQARDLAPDGPVAVLLPDDVILGGTGAMSDMVNAAARCDCAHLVATMPVSRAEVSRYGIIAPKSPWRGSILPALTVTEKPAPERAPSCNAVVGRYILGPGIFDRLAALGPGAGGEIQLTDAIAKDAPRAGLAGVAFKGRRFDCGSKDGHLAATLARACADPAFAHVLGHAHAA